MATDVVAYVDASALAKLLVKEPETTALGEHVAGRRLTTSELTLVEITRVEKLAAPMQVTGASIDGLLAEIDLLSVSRAVLRRAAELTSMRLRTLDAVHLATALVAGVDELVAYDRRLLDAAAEAGLAVTSPGA